MQGRAGFQEPAHGFLSQHPSEALFKCWQSWSDILSLRPRFRLQLGLLGVTQRNPAAGTCYPLDGGKRKPLSRKELSCDRAEGFSVCRLSVQLSRELGDSKRRTPVRRTQPRLVNISSIPEMSGCLRDTQEAKEMSESRKGLLTWEHLTIPSRAGGGEGSPLC